MKIHLYFDGAFDVNRVLFARMAALSRFQLLLYSGARYFPLRQLASLLQTLMEVAIAHRQNPTLAKSI